MNREIIARLLPGRLSIDMPWTLAALLLMNTLRPLWDWPTDGMDVGIWAISLAVLVWIPIRAIIQKARSKGAAVWTEASLLHSLSWSEPIEVAKIADVRISPPRKSLFDKTGAVLLVLNDGRIREIDGGALSPSLPDIATQIMNLPGRPSSPR